MTIPSCTEAQAYFLQISSMCVGCLPTCMRRHSVRFQAADPVTLDDRMTVTLYVNYNWQLYLST